MGFLADDKIECFFLSEEFNTGFFLLAVKIELLVLVAVVFVVLLEANEPELTLILELELEFEFGFCQLEKKSSTLFSLEFDLEASESVSNGESASSWLFNTKADGYNSCLLYTSGLCTYEMGRGGGVR